MPSATDEVTVPPIRVLVADLTDDRYQMLLTQLASQPRITLVERVSGRLELLLAMTAVIDLVVLGSEVTNVYPGIISHLLMEFPDLKVMVMLGTNQPALLYWRGIRVRPVARDSEVVDADVLRYAYDLNPMD